MAPDVIRIGERYYVAYAIGGGGMNVAGTPARSGSCGRSKPSTWPRLEFGYHEVGTVAVERRGREAAYAIDPAFLARRGPPVGWSYGTYFGSIRHGRVLDPATGQRMAGNQPVDVAIDMEATALLHRDGWYCLLGTHGTCCDGLNSTYNIRVGRSRDVLGSLRRQHGRPLLGGGGKLAAAAHGRTVGAGHFGLIDLGRACE